MKRTSTLAAAAAIAVAGAITITAPTLFAGTDRAGQAPLGPPALVGAGAATRLVAEDPARFHKADADLLEQRQVTPAGALTYVAFERTHRDLPVIGGDAVVVTDRDGRVLDSRVAQREPLAASAAATVPAAAAERTARRELRRAVATGKPRLVVVAQGRGVLAHEVVVAGVDADGHAARLHVHVDARTGRVLRDWTWNEILHGSGDGGFYKGVQFGTTGDGSSFTMRDPARSGVECGGQDGRPFTRTGDTWGTGAGTDLESACVDAMYALTQEWDMLKQWLDRDGIDGAGKAFPMRVGLKDVNAFYNGRFTSFGHSQDNRRQLTNIDVVAHEQGHGIFATTPGGSTGNKETGGMNEATGDIFGALTEAFANNPADRPDYEVGRIADLVGQGPIRYMYDPSKLDDPNCYSSRLPGTEVHAAAGPLNHWFYLLAEGSHPTNGLPASPTCDNSTVTGIGIKKAGQIFMSALMRKTSNWTHPAARSASVKAASELFPATNECRRVKAAWDAVSVPAAAGEATCPDTGPTDGPTPTPTASPTGSPSGTPTTSPTAGPVEVPKVETARVKAHLQRFQEIADANGGTRRAGRPGYEASQKYVADTMRAAGYTVTVQPCPSPSCTGGASVIAESTTGSTDEVVMFGAHLDSVAAGPGINDNGSGSATILETALVLAATKPDLAKRVRFAWWTDEEQGLNGSRYYLEQLGADKSKIKAYLNFDMVASVNGGYFINNIGTALGGAFKEYYDRAGIPTEENTEGRNRSDDASFTDAGIPASGVAAGASARITSAQAQKWGRRANEPRDPCYHRACDTVRNIDDTILGHAANAQMAALYKLAVKTRGAPTGPTQGREFTTAERVAVRDYRTAYSRIKVAGVTGKARGSVVVTVSAVHACAQDLRIDLFAPNGRQYNLQQSRATTNDCQRFGSRAFTVSGVDTAANGDWWLRVRDDHRRDEGTVTGWRLVL